MTGSSFLSRAWVSSLLAGVGAIAVFATPTDAQLVEDTTPGRSLGTTVQRDVVPGIDVITDGAQRGQNLFHSFREFNVGAGRGVYFAIPDNIVRNVLTRVTGGNRSEILGTLGTFRPSDGTVRVPGVNLFLINPNGIVFGENARLDVGGSFFATTANAVKLGETGLFSASQTATSNLLTVDPSAFLFSQISPAPIQNLSQGFAGLDPTGTAFISGLRVSDGQGIFLVGGNVQLQGGNLYAFGGTIELGGLSSPGTIALQTKGNTFQLKFPNEASRSDITLTNSDVSVRLTGNGAIRIYANNVELNQGSRFLAGIAAGVTSNTTQGGNIEIDAQGQVTLSDSSDISNILNQGAGKIGDIKIAANSLTATSGSQIVAATIGQGNAGNIELNIRDRINLEGFNLEGRPTAIASGVQPSANGQSGDINIQTGSLIISQGAAISNTTFGQGDSGRIIIDAKGLVLIDGESLFSVPRSISGGIYSGVGFSGVGNGGDLQITSRFLMVSNGGELKADTSNGGKAGNIFISALESVKFSGVSSLGRQSGIFTQLVNGIGEGGNIELNTPSLHIKDGAAISSITAAQGNAGRIKIVAPNFVTIEGVKSGQSSFISSSVFTTGVGNAGDIEFFTRALEVSNGAFIATSTFGQGNAGSILINAQDKVLLDSKQREDGLTSFVQSAVGLPEAIGQGGQIRVRTNAFTILNNAGLSSETFGQGNAGNIALDVDSFTAISGASLNSTSSGLGNAGNVVIHARGAVQLNNSTIETRSRSSSGGDIQVSAERIRLFGNSDLRTFVETGSGKGGDIILTADSIVALNDSDILTFSTGGSGGNITFNTPAFFGQNYRPGSPPPFDGNNRVDVNASGTISGIITIPDTTFIQNSLTQLAQNLIDPNTLLANSCIVRSRDRTSNGTFLVTGSGGLPVRPGDAPPASFPTGEVRSLPTTQSQNNRPWQPGDPIVEPQGIYRLPNGKLVMSRECQTQ